MKMIDYKILWGESCGKLEAEVKEKIREGWQPLGGICLKHDPDWDTVFYQAMIRDTPPTYSVTLNSVTRQVWDIPEEDEAWKGL